MTEFLVIQRVLIRVKVPEFATTVFQLFKICVMLKSERLLQVDDLILRFELQELCFRNFDQNLVAKGPGNFIVAFSEDWDCLLNSQR